MYNKNKKQKKKNDLQ